MQNLGIDILFNYQVIYRLLKGMFYSLEISLLSILLSIILGTLFGFIRISENRIIKFLFKLYLEIVRILPTLVLLYVLSFSLPNIFNINVNSFFVAMIAFTFWGAAEVSDIVRFSVISMPKHQTESALAIGLSKLQLFYFIIGPQMIKRVIPSIVNLSMRIIMTSSLLVLIGIREVIKVAKEIIEANVFINDMAPFWIYGFVLLLFFIICYPLSKLAIILENKWKLP